MQYHECVCPSHMMLIYVLYACFTVGSSSGRHVAGDRGII